MSDQLGPYLVLSSGLLALGVYGVLARRNLIAMLIALELILNAANVNFVALNRFVMPDKGTGQIMALFVIALAGAEIAVALAIVRLFFRHSQSVAAEDAKELKG